MTANVAAERLPQRDRQREAGEAAAADQHVHAVVSGPAIAAIIAARARQTAGRALTSGRGNATGCAGLRSHVLRRPRPSRTFSTSNSWRSTCSAAARRRSGWQRVFGGQVIGQALVAACRTVEDRPPHSLHAYFLLAGDPKVPIIYEVERIRDGKSFTTRRVVGDPARPGRSSPCRRRSTPTSRASRIRPRCRTCRMPEELPSEAEIRAALPADDARPGAPLLRARAPDRAAAGRVRALSRQEDRRRAFPCLDPRDAASCPTTRPSINACSPMPPT